jgi:hypothetical protein
MENVAGVKKKSKGKENRFAIQTLYRFALGQEAVLG